MAMSMLQSAYGQLVNGTFGQQVLNNCTEACSAMSCVTTQKDAYCSGEADRADLAAKTDVCARGALLLAGVPCVCVAIKEGVRAIEARSWSEKAAHITKSVGWGAVAYSCEWLAMNAPFFGGTVDQYGIACHGPQQ
jgi:hypothetical protein